MGLSFLAAILGFLWKSEQSKRFQNIAKAERDRAKAQKRISKELSDGEKRYQETIDESKESDPYDHFRR